MSGSMKDMVYEADNGDLYVTRIDESNGEAFGFADYTGAETIVGRLPQAGFEMRYVNWASNDGTLTRQFKVGAPDNDSFLNGGAFTVLTIEGTSLSSKPGVLTSARGEKRRLPKAEDTGLQDGDAT